MEFGDDPFVGSEALEAGLVDKYGLRARYSALFPDVYLSSDVEASYLQRIRAAWLWSRRQGVASGLSAAAMHGAKWIDDSALVELVWPNSRSPRGIRTHDYRLGSDEFLFRDDMPVTTVARTAFDVGRAGRLNDAVARLDALGNATHFRPDDVRELARRHRGVRGKRQLETALHLYDPGAESPRETWLRLLLISEGLPRPQTQIPVLGTNGRPRYYLDMGWEELRVAVEYDGEHHRLDRSTYANDLIRAEFIQHRKWIVVRVVVGQSRADIMRRVRDARASRLQ